ncbi:hypothetical protein HY375_02885 [Candidatus Berkelbacteria bacterium]|nr:hypothetical protein [Candidatus Berkelbacteria bacterium]
MEPYRRRRRERASAPNILTQLGIALAGLWRLLFGKKQAPIDRVRIVAKFGEIEALLAHGDGATASQAVLQADSLLDEVMRAVGGRGETFADRFRSLEGRFDRALYQQIWEEHKLRNTIAHEHPNITAAQGRQAVQVFRRAASRLGAL